MLITDMVQAVADVVCGGFRLADMVVADIVCGRYRRNSFRQRSV